MNIVIIGYGSIGKRHARNLKSLGATVRSIDTDEIDNADKILAEAKFDLGLVCTPTNLHLQHALLLAKHGIHFFCEKPLYVKKDKALLDELYRHVRSKNLINMVGCNLRFHPVINALKNNVFKGTEQIKIFFGYDLRKWHNDGKHLQLYSANKSMGGGITFDAIHEFDYISYVLGPIERMDITQSRVGEVTVDTEDLVKGYIYIKNGIKVDIHLDYLSEKYQRYFIIDGEITHITPNNDMYIKEMEYLLNNINDKRYCMNDILEASDLIDCINRGIKR